jgi:hypothetical protein
MIRAIALSSGCARARPESQGVATTPVKSPPAIRLREIML